jgi:hypothetical protein
VIGSKSTFSLNDHRLVWHSFGEDGPAEVAAYDATSGVSHIVSSLALDIKEVLSAEPHGLQLVQIAERLELINSDSSQSDEDVTETLALLGELLNQLVMIGMVSRLDEPHST